MATRSEILTSVLNELDNSDYDTTTLNQYINDINRRIVNRHKFPFMETTSNVTINQSEVEVALPATAQVIYTLRITAPTDEERDLTRYFLNTDEFDYRFPDPTSESEAQLSFWTFSADTIYFSQPADQSYTLTVRYYKDPTDLTSDSSTLDVPDEFQELVVLGVVAKALARDDFYDEAQVRKAEYEELLNDLVIRYSSKQTGRPLIMPSNKNFINKRFFRDD